MNTFEKDINKIYAKLKRFGVKILRRMLCNEDEACNESFENDFYKMSAFDDMIIFDITANEEIHIPHMTLTQPKDILFKKLNLNIACDVFKLTVEHIRNDGNNFFFLS